MLRQSLDRCDKLDVYTFSFANRERRGSAQTLSPWEHTKIDYRRAPKAIKITWQNPNSDYAQAVYAQGRNRGQVETLARHGMFGLKPRPFFVDIATPISYGKSLRPITDLGLAELLRLTFKEMQHVRQVGEVRVTYAGQDHPPDMNEQADHIVIHYPPGSSDAIQQDVYISTRTGYPIATYLWRASGELLAVYLYGPPTLLSPTADLFHLSRASG